MSDKYSMPLWRFDEDGTCRGYYLVKDVSNLGDFYESPWEAIEYSMWRSDEEGDVIGYYLVKDVSVLGTFNDFGEKLKTDCSSYDGAHLCEKRRWRRKGCCCIGWDRNEEKIPRSCSG